MFIIINAHNQQNIQAVPINPTITNTSSANYNDPAGEIFVTVGTRGINIHALSGKSSYVKYRQDDKFGALNLIL